jgi:hypothetical protein
MKALLALAAATVLAVACSGTPDGSVHAEPGGSAGTGPARASELAYAACLRSHGVPNFPDPVGRGAIVITPHSGINLNSPRFVAAERACRRLAPQNGAITAATVQDEADFLRFSRCMQSHGFPDFPEPKIVGGAAELLRPAVNSATSWEPGSPRFASAWARCHHYQPYGGPASPPPAAPAGPSPAHTATTPGGGVASS